MCWPHLRKPLVFDISLLRVFIELIVRYVSRQSSTLIFVNFILFIYLDSSQGCAHNNSIYLLLHVAVVKYYSPADPVNFPVGENQRVWAN